MTSRRAPRTFAAAAFGLWLLLVIQAVESPVLLDDWFQLRYWRDHEFGLAAIVANARHNYFHYNPRLGEVWLAIIDGCRPLHLLLTPLVQLGLLACVFAIAFGSWPRRTWRDLQLLLFIQTMIWLVIPSPAIMYFYRPFATNYLWGCAITLALFVPYRLALVGPAAPARPWLAPIMLALGWVAGMSNEHTGPAAMVAMAAALYLARRLGRLRAWMVAGMVGLYVGYPMLFFAPGQSERYGGIATRYPPTTLLVQRGVAGCFAVVRSFVFEARLGILVIVATAIAYVVTIRLRRERLPAPPRDAVIAAAVLVAASLAIVGTLFMSPTASGRVLLAPGVLLVAAFALGARQMFVEPGVRTFVIGACIIVFSYHVVRFVDASFEVASENQQRIAILRAAAPGTVAVVPTYSSARPSRWVFGDDFAASPWLRDYVGGELFDLARIDLDRPGRPPAARLVITPSSVVKPPTYRQLQAPWTRARLVAELGDRFTIEAIGMFDDVHHRPVVACEASPAGGVFVDGSPYDTALGHFIRVRRDSLPPRVDAAYVIGCGQTFEGSLGRGDADALLPVDERLCRGPFTAIVCAPGRCWVAGWY